jgi:hypothetical protein
MLNRLRGEQPTDGAYLLVCLEPFRKWALARKETRRGSAVELIPNMTFTSPEEAEWEVFKLLWQAQTGEKL